MKQENDKRNDPPAWHAKALQETEERRARGLETPMDWENEKTRLRSKFS